MADLDLVAVAKARTKLQGIVAAHTAALAELRAAREAKQQLDVRGLGGTKLERAIAKITALETKAGGIETTRRKAEEAILKLRDAIVTRAKPEDLVKSLDGSRPVTLLPVRLETRFFADGAELRVRIYPDQIHLDQHDAALTPGERQAGEWYWSARAAAATNASAARAAFAELAQSFGATRAAWIAQAARPGQTPQVRAARWSRAAVATLLPDRFLVVGYRRGRVQFRKWGRSVPDRLVVSLTPEPGAAESPDQPPPATLPLSADLRWIADYAYAERRGMAVTIKQSDVLDGQPALSHGVDRLVVLGVDWTLGPDDASAALNALLEAHLYGDGLSIVPQGTPTNHTGSTAAADEPDLVALLDPLVTDAVATPLPPALALGKALGVPDGPVLRCLPGATSTETATAAALVDALWPSTAGFYVAHLLEPLIAPSQQVALRNHARSHLRPAGIAPTLRIGKQPYGILPLLPRTKQSDEAEWGFEQANSFEGKLFDLLKRARKPWSLAVKRVPCAVDGEAPDDPVGTLELRMKAILEHAPVASALRFRRVLSASTVANANVPPELLKVQQRIFEILEGHYGWKKRPYLSNLTLEKEQHPLAVPFVQSTKPGAAPPTPNYINEIAVLVRQVRGRDELLKRLQHFERGDGLMNALLTLAAVQVLDTATLAALRPDAAPDSGAQIDATNFYFRMAEAVAIEERPGAPAGQLLVSTPGEASRVILPRLDANRPVSELVVVGLNSTSVASKLPTNALDPLRGFLSALDVLKTCGAAELDWALRGVLDCLSYRIDAWITSLANRRLAAVRGRAASRTGSHVGAYGWVHDLVPDGAKPESQGHILAPSLPHAATAAILRSGHLAHSDTDATALDVDLSSERVARAAALLSGVARGQPLAVLLGYRLERNLRDRDVRLAQFILPIRKVAPFRAARAGSPAATDVSEAIAARDVCDGVALVQRLRENPRALVTQIAKALNPAGVPLDLQALLRKELDALSELLDAVTDVLMAESVHQTVLGNPERAAAALGVLDRQTRPPPPAVIETPRTGHTYTQRAVVLTNELLPVPFGAPAVDVLQAWNGFCKDARSRAEPRVNAWVGRVLGQPKRYRFSATLVTQNTAGSSVRRPLPPIALPVLGLSPLGLLAAARLGSANRPSELQQRIVHAFLAQVPEAGGDVALELSPDAPEPGDIGLDALESLLGLLSELLGSARPIDARDFALPAAPPLPGWRVVDVRKRADALVERLLKVAAPLRAALANAAVVPGDVRGALLGVSNAGFPGAFPLLVSVANMAANDEPVQRLLDQARDVDAALQGKLARISARDTAWTAFTDKSPEAEIEHHTARIREALGKDFPVVLPFDIAAGEELKASLGDAAALTAGDPSAPANWLQRLALVRPTLDRLASVVTAAELLQTGVPSQGLAVLQRPHDPGSRWLALPQTGTNAKAELAVTLQSFAPAVLDGSVLGAGFFVDDWSEVIPSAQETVAATFQYDAPGARPPNAILVAVPPSLSPSSWSVDALLEMVNEAQDLAQLRMVRPEQVDLHGLLLPTTYLPDSVLDEVPTLNLIKFKDDVEALEQPNTTGKNVTWIFS